MQSSAHDHGLPRHEGDHEKGYDSVEDRHWPHRPTAQHEHEEPCRGRQRDHDKEEQVGLPTTHRSTKSQGCQSPERDAPALAARSAAFVPLLKAVIPQVELSAAIMASPARGRQHGVRAVAIL